MMLPRKKMLPLTVLVIVAVITYFAVSTRFTNTKNNGVDDTTLPSLHGTESVQLDSDVLLAGKNNISHETMASQSVSSELESGVMTAADVDVVKRWQLDRGYTLFLPNDEYKTYNKDTLQKLASSGDIRALQQLAERSGFSDEAKSLYKRAATLGSTYALTSLSRLSASSSRVSDDPLVKKGYVIESMAYAKVASMRGDNNHYFSDMKSPISTNPSGVQLSESDYTQVKTLAEKIYKDLEQERESLGLGSFDNAVPPEVVQHYANFDPRLSGITLRY